MNVVEWCWYRALSKLLEYPRVPYTRADPYRLYEELMSDGCSNWGRHVVFVDWLSGTFGKEAGRAIWQHIRKSRKGEATNHEKILESSV